MSERCVRTLNTICYRNPKSRPGKSAALGLAMEDAVNCDKIEEVIFSVKWSKTEHPSLKLGLDEVARKDEHKHLGLILDSKLNFKSHIRQAILKARRGIGMIKYLSIYVFHFISFIIITFHFIIFIQGKYSIQKVKLIYKLPCYKRK